MKTTNPDHVVIKIKESEQLRALIAAESKRPILIPIFPVVGFEPTATCSHHDPIRDGSVFVCMVCHDAGLRDHRALQLNPAMLPKPEPVEAEDAKPREPEPTGPLTRKQRRALKHKASHVGPTAHAT